MTVKRRLRQIRKRPERGIPFAYLTRSAGRDRKFPDRFMRALCQSVLVHLVGLLQVPEVINVSNISATLVRNLNATVEAGETIAGALFSGVNEPFTVLNRLDRPTSELVAPERRQAVDASRRRNFEEAEEFRILWNEAHVSWLSQHIQSRRARLKRRHGLAMSDRARESCSERKDKCQTWTKPEF